MSILISNNHPKITLNETKLTRFISKCLKELNFSKAEVSLLFTTDTEIKQLNKEYRNINKPTDILSFGMREHRNQNDPMPPHPEVLGDLVLSLDTIKKQADTRKVDMEEELEFIIVHGLLHLLGYDHASPIDKIRMDTLHSSIMNACK